LPVLGNGGQIEFLDGKDFIVDKEGNISIDGEEIDTLKIVSFNIPNSLEKVGNTRFAPTGSGTIEEKAEGFGINQGFIELSNVNAISVMLEMIEVLRGYESYKKVIQSVDDVTSKAINEVGQLA
jgi:flagellar basal-body rod protein FlgG